MCYTVTMSNNNPITVAVQAFNSFSLAAGSAGPNAHALGGSAPRKDREQLSEEYTGLIQGTIDAFTWALGNVPELAGDDAYIAIRDQLILNLGMTESLDHLFEQAMYAHEALTYLDSDVSNLLD